jgi:hypothetical protein
MSKERVNAIAELFEASTGAAIAAAEQVPEDQRMNQVHAGKSHPLWQLGHMAAVTGNAAMGVCLGKTPSVPAEYRGHFAPAAMGGQPVQSDASAYPAWDDVLATYKAVATEVAASIRELEDSELAEAPRGPVPEPLKERFEVLGNSLVFLAMHNMYHVGQMNLLAALDESAVAA